MLRPRLRARGPATRGGTGRRHRPGGSRRRRADARAPGLPGEPVDQLGGLAAADQDHHRGDEAGCSDRRPVELNALLAASAARACRPWGVRSAGPGRRPVPVRWRRRPPSRLIRSRDRSGAARRQLPVRPVDDLDLLRGPLCWVLCSAERPDRVAEHGHQPRRLLPRQPHLQVRRAARMPRCSTGNGRSRPGCTRVLVALRGARCARSGTVSAGDVIRPGLTRDPAALPHRRSSRGASVQCSELSQLSADHVPRARHLSRRTPLRQAWRSRTALLRATNCAAMQRAARCLRRRHSPRTRIQGGRKRPTTFGPKTLGGGGRHAGRRAGQS